MLGTEANTGADVINPVTPQSHGKYISVTSQQKPLTCEFSEATPTSK